MKVVKKFVEVVAKFDEDGITPVSIHWPDGRVFYINQVLDIRPAASIPAGGGFGILAGSGRMRLFYFMRNHGGLWKRKAKNKKGG